jgi:hypothetical protein
LAITRNGTSLREGLAARMLRRSRTAIDDGSSCDRLGAEQEDNP